MQFSLYSEYLIWADRDQVALFFILAKASHALNSSSAAFDEWIPLSKSPRSMYLRLLLGKNEKYPFFIKGEDDEKVVFGLSDIRYAMGTG